jgi:hypothetical protein
VVQSGAVLEVTARQFDGGLRAVIGGFDMVLGDLVELADVPERKLPQPATSRSLRTRPVFVTR